jgi:diguanylate cyclase (GGDEF)-like protein
VLGRLGGLLLLAGAAIGALAHGGRSDPVAAEPLWTPVAVAVGAGVLCLVVPWRRVPGFWLHLVPITAAVLIAAAIAAHGTHGGMYAPLLLCPAAFAALAFRSRGAIALHLAILVACSAVPLVYAGVPASVQGGPIALEAFALITVTLSMVAVRERMEAGQDALRALAQSDPLTGVGNYRRLYSRMSDEMARHRRSGQSLALLVMDLDGFKAVNDELGHPEGDRVLERVADALVGTVREQDTVVRQGGDEFAVLAPETGAEAAGALVARIERALDGIDAGGLPLAASVGWALFPDDAEERMALMEAADARQRAVKRGRQASAHPGKRLSA